MSEFTEQEEGALRLLIAANAHTLIRGQLDGEDVAMVAIPVPPEVATDRGLDPGVVPLAVLAVVLTDTLKAHITSDAGEFVPPSKFKPDFTA